MMTFSLTDTPFNDIAIEVYDGDGAKFYIGFIGITWTCDHKGKDCELIGVDEI
jgi:hypothetical protein